MLSAIGYLVGSRVLDPTRLIGVVTDALLDPRDWSIRQLAVTVGAARLNHTVGLDPQAIHADRPQDPERAKAIAWHPVASDRTALPIWPADGRAGATPWRHGPADRLDGMPPPARLERLDLRQPAEPVGAVDAGRNESSRGDDSSRGAVSTRSARPSHSTEAEPATWLPARTLIGRDVLALDHPVGRLQDLVFDDLSWAVRYLIVALNDRGPTPRRVLVGIDWLDRESAPLGAAAPPDHPLRLALSATQLRLSPGFEDVGSIDAALEQRLPVRTPHRVAMAAAGG